jgi:glycosyltransferase involved in cell wall biosynthesis
MRVLHVLSSLDPKAGGPPAAISGLAPAQVEAGADVTVFATFARRTDYSIVERLRSSGVTVHLVGPCVLPLGLHPKTRSQVRSEVAAAHVVHIHALWEDVQHQAATACRALGIPYLVRPCGMLDPWSLRQGHWKKRIYMWLRLRGDLEAAAALHFTSDSERDLATPLRLTPPSIVEPNGVDLSEFTPLPPKGTFRRRYPQFHGRPMLLFLSRIHPGKGLDVLVPAFGRCLRDVPPRQKPFLVIAGSDSGGHESKVRAMIATCGIQDHVVFAGPLYGCDKVAAYTDADLFVLPSRHENFGNAVVEALAAGCPVVLSEHVAIAQEIAAAGVGLCCLVQAESVAATLSQLLNDPHARGAAAARTRPFVEGRYDWRLIAERLAAHYAGLATP